MGNGSGEEKSKVAIMRCGSYDAGELTEKINGGVESLGGWDAFVRPGMTALLKVNLISPLPPGSAAVTHCEFARAVTRILKDRGCEVWIGDSSGGAFGRKAQTAKCFEVSGMNKIAKEEGAIIKNFEKEGVAAVTVSGGGVMHIAKPLFDADVVINLPKFKTHMFTGFTGAYKNLFGCIPGLKKAEYHKTAQDPESFGRVLYEINRNLRIGLNIMDAVEAMDGQGPVAGRVYRAGKIMISADRLALDSAALRMIGLDIEDMPVYAAALENGFGKWRESDVEITGDFDSPPRLRGFKVPAMFLGRARKSRIFGRLVDVLKKKPSINIKACKKCRVCENSCPMKAIDIGTFTIDYTKCINCMCCHEMCVYKAIKLVNADPPLKVIFGRNK